MKWPYVGMGHLAALAYGVPGLKLPTRGRLERYVGLVSPLRGCGMSANETFCKDVCLGDAPKCPMR
jgi:hypothetical protein